MTKKDVTIIIVAYKSAHIISETLQNITNKGYRIIIVDNNSGDNIEQHLRQHYPNSGIELILLSSNCGFGRANNVALELTTTKYAFLLNPDAIITEQSIDNLVLEANKDSQIALASPFPTSKQNPSYAEQQTNIDNYRANIRIIAENNNMIETNFICGGHLLMNMDIFRKIGFFDKNIFLYGEDNEISGRSIVNGYKNILVKTAQVFHYNKKSTKTNSILGAYELLYLREWHHGWGKTYLKRKKKNYFRIWLKTIHQFLICLVCLIKLDKKQAIMRLAMFLGSSSNLLGISCFNKKNKTTIILQHIII